MKKTIITIARGYGSGGRTIGKMLAENLKIPFYDRNLLYIASDESGINLGLFQQSDEELKKSIFDPETHKYNGELIPPEDSKFVSKENLFNYQAKIIKDVAEKESCVIVGRCADFILQDRADVVRVFIWAPHADCIKNVMDVSALNEKDADKKIKRIDRHRSDYYHYYTCREWDNVRNYDLCLNSSELGYEGCVKTIKAYIDIINEIR